MMPVSITQGFKHCGLFGTIRKHDIHTGLDFYCEEGAPVSCIQDGIVIDIFQFTGEAVNTPWWNNTFAIVVECDEHIYVYGEVVPYVKIGEAVEVGHVIGRVIPVLKKDKGVTPTTMLHLEVWEKTGYQKNCIWFLGHHKPDGLLNPMEFV